MHDETPAGMAVRARTLARYGVPAHSRRYLVTRAIARTVARTLAAFCLIGAPTLAGCILASLIR